MRSYVELCTSFVGMAQLCFAGLEIVSVGAQWGIRHVRRSSGDQFPTRLQVHVENGTRVHNARIANGNIIKGTAGSPSMYTVRHSSGAREGRATGAARSSP